MKVIGIDIGTTSISAVVLDMEIQCVLTSKTIPNGSFIETESQWERIQDVSVVIGKAIAVLDELLERYPDVISIGLTGQMHGILYLNKEGDSISPLYIWQDGRGNLPMKDIKTYRTLFTSMFSISAFTFGGGAVIRQHPQQVYRVSISNPFELADADTPEALALLAQLAD